MGEGEAGMQWVRPGVGVQSVDRGEGGFWLKIGTGVRRRGASAGILGACGNRVRGE